MRPRYLLRSRRGVNIALPSARATALHSFYAAAAGVVADATLALNDSRASP
jgi:hypothetical protein